MRTGSSKRPWLKRNRWIFGLLGFHQFENFGATRFFQLSQDVRGVVRRHLFDDIRDFLGGHLLEDIRLGLVIEFRQDIRLDFIGQDFEEPVLVVRISVVDDFGDVGRMQLIEKLWNLFPKLTFNAEIDPFLDAGAVVRHVQTPW